MSITTLDYTLAQAKPFVCVYTLYWLVYSSTLLLLAGYGHSVRLIFARPYDINQYSPRDIIITSFHSPAESNQLLDQWTLQKSIACCITQLPSPLFCSPPPPAECSNAPPLSSGRYRPAIDSIMYRRGRHVADQHTTRPVPISSKCDRQNLLVHPVFTITL